MINLKQIFYEIFQLQWDLWLIFFLASFVVAFSTVFLAFRYKAIIASLNEDIRFFDSFNITCLTQFVSYLSPFRIGTIFTKPFVTKVISSISFKKSMLASVFEQFFDITWQITLLPIFVYLVGNEYLHVSGLFSFFIIILLFGSLVFIVVHSKNAVEILWKIKFIVPRFVRDFSKKKKISKERVLELIEKSKLHLNNRKMLFIITIMTFIHFVLSALTLELFLLYFKYQVLYFLVLAGFWAPNIIGRFSGIPFGLGVRDVSLGAILVAFGVTIADSAKIVILTRLSVILPITIFGVIFLVYNGRKIRNFRGMLRKRIFS